MRAKFINEVQNFERGKAPKRALEIGGINLAREKAKMKEKFTSDWNSFLKTILDGKTISGQMNKVEHKGKKANPIQNGWGNYTVKVDTWDLDDEGILNRSIFITTDDGDMYVLPINDKKIYIENES